MFFCKDSDAVGTRMYMVLHEHIFTSGVGLFIFFDVAIWLFCFAPTKKEKRHLKCVA